MQEISWAKKTYGPLTVDDVDELPVVWTGEEPPAVLVGILPGTLTYANTPFDALPQKSLG